MPALRPTSKRFAPAWVALALTLSAAVASAQLVYPGKDPGPATVLSEGARIVASHAVIAANWLAGDQGLRPQFVRDVANQRRMVLTGEVFAIIFANGQRKKGSATSI